MEVRNRGDWSQRPTSDLRHYLNAALEKIDTNTEEICYRDPPTAEDLKKEKEAADERGKREKAISMTRGSSHGVRSCEKERRGTEVVELVSDGLRSFTIRFAQVSISALNVGAFTSLNRLSFRTSAPDTVRSVPKNPGT